MKWRDVVIVGILLATAIGQDAGDRIHIDDARLAEIVERVVPAVEHATGRKFARRPMAVLGDAGDVMRALREELEPDVARYFAGNTKARQQRVLQLRADVLAGSLLGKYAFGDREVFLLPQAVTRTLVALGWPGVVGDQVMQLVLVHELVHAMQDQELGLGQRLAQCAGEDATEAISMMVEGHAVFCSERAAAELGLESAIEPLRSVLTGQHDPTKVPGCRLELRRVVGRGTVTYLDSAAFFARQHELGGDDRLWQILANPKPTTNELLFDASKATGAAVLRDRGACLQGLDGCCGGNGWTVGRGDLSPVALLIENLSQRESMLPVLGALRGGGQWSGIGVTSAMWRHAWLLEFADNASATRFVEIAEAGAMQDLKGIAGLVSAAGAGPALEDVVSRSVTQQPTDEKFHGVSRVRICWFRRGPGVFQITLTNAPLDDEVLAAAAHDVLTRSGAAR